MEILSSELLVKLNALRNIVKKTIEGTTPQEMVMPPRYFDPQYVMDLFTRYQTIRDNLKTDFAALFDDLPIREVKASGTTDFDGRGYIERHQIQLLLRDIENCLDLLSGLPIVDIPSMKITREGVYFAGQYFDALKSFKDILSGAKRKIDMIDGYINEQVLDILTSKNSSVEVNILTKTVSPSLKIATQRFNQQYGKLSIRSSQAFHDRFVIIDNVDYYHFGASIKDLGKRGFMFSLIEEPSVITTLSKHYLQEWKIAKVEV